LLFHAGAGVADEKYDTWYGGPPVT
jgi:hypothetical protein